MNSTRVKAETAVQTILQCKLALAGVKFVFYLHHDWILLLPHLVMWNN